MLNKQTKSVNYYGILTKSESKDPNKMVEIADINYNFNLRTENGAELPLLSEAINFAIEDSKVDTNSLSDGYHTFGELYNHRIANFRQLCRALAYVPDCTHIVWRSLKHSDGELVYGGSWFVLGINTEPGKQITYHLPIEQWIPCTFAKTLEKAPEWDGHTSSDVLDRLSKL